MEFPPGEKFFWTRRDCAFMEIAKEFQKVLFCGLPGWAGAVPGSAARDNQSIARSHRTVVARSLVRVVGQSGDGGGCDILLRAYDKYITAHGGGRTDGYGDGLASQSRAP